MSFVELCLYGCAGFLSFLWLIVLWMDFKMSKLRFLSIFSYHKF